MNDKLNVSKAEQFNAIVRYKQLWHLSLCFCDPFPPSFEPLGRFVALGFLDVSFTQIKFKHLLSLHKTHLMRFNCFGCPQLEQETYYRGYLIHILPHLFQMNGIYITGDERDKWFNYFNNQSGSYSSISRKFKLNDSLFAPSQPDDSYTDIKSSQAEALLKDRPASFFMPLDLDHWRIQKLADEFKRRILTNFDSEDHPIVNQCLDAFLSVKESRSQSDKSLFLLLLSASLVDGIPMVLIQGILSSRFQAEWTNPRLSPLHWSLTNRLYFVGLLVPLLYLCNQSPIKTKAPFVIQDFVLKLIARMTSRMLQACYPNKKASFDLDSLCYYDPEKFMSILKMEEIAGFALLRLFFIEIMTLNPYDLSFVTSFESLYRILNSSRAILAPEMHLHWNPRHIAGLKDWKESSGLSTRGKAAELKILLQKYCNSIYESFDADPEHRLDAFGSFLEIQPVSLS